MHFSGDIASMGMAPRLGSPLLTRWLLFAALKETYSECPSALDDAMAMVLEDLNFACHTGVTVNLFGQSRRLRFVAVSVKGDWPFLIEAAHLERHFRRAPKRERSDMCSNLGVCHLCLGGYQGIPYEDFAEVPQWEQTMQSAAAMVPWHSNHHGIRCPAFLISDLGHSGLIFSTIFILATGAISWALHSWFWRHFRKGLVLKPVSSPCPTAGWHSAAEEVYLGCMHFLIILINPCFFGRWVSHIFFLQPKTRQIGAALFAETLSWVGGLHGGPWLAGGKWQKGATTTLLMESWLQWPKIPNLAHTVFILIKST